MLDFLCASGPFRGRKARLFAAACCRRFWHLLEAPSRHAVEVVERLADGLATEAERASAEVEARAVSARLAADAFALGGPPPVAPLAAAAVLNLTVSAEEEAKWLRGGQSIAQLVAVHVWLAQWQLLGEAAVERVRLGEVDRPGRDLCDLLRDILGPLPFRQVRLAPWVVAWQQGMVGKLALALYEERAFTPERMGVLADALEEAGCDSAEMLRHCREPGVHVPGCWLVDLLTGKG